MMRLLPMLVGPGRNCRTKLNGIAPLARRAMAASAPILGVRSHRRPVTAISIFNDGIPFLPDRLPTGPAISVLPTLPAMDGSGRARFSRLFRGLKRSPFIPARSEEHTSELQSLRHLVCRLLLE